MAKRIVIALLFLSGFYTIQAQTLTWKDLYRQAKELYNKEEYGKAIPVARQAMEAAGREFGYDHENYITSSNLLANIFFESADYENAEALFLDLLNRKKKLYGEQHPAYAETLLDLGILYSEKTGQQEKAEKMFTPYAEIIRQLKGDKSGEYATALNSLGNVYTNLNDLKNAELFYTRARDLRRELFGTRNEDYLFTTQNLGYLYSLTRQYPYAISCLDEVVKEADASGKNKGEDHALNLFLLGKALMAEGIYKRADTTLWQATERYKILYGAESADYAGCINELGLLYDKTGAFEKAKTMLEKALALIKNIYGDTSSHYATVLNNLALLYHNNDSLVRAANNFQQVLGIMDKSGETGTEAYAVLLNNLARIYFSLGKNSQAEEYFSRAVILLREKDFQPTFESAIKNQAEFYETTKGVQAAEDYLIRETREIKEKTGVHNGKYIFLLKFMAAVYQVSGRPEEAEANYVRAKDLLKEWVGDKDPQYAEGLNILASFYTGLGRFEKGLPLLLEAAGIFQSAFGQRNSSYIHCFNQIAMVSLETGQYQLTLDLFEEMKALTADVFGTRHKEFAYALARIGHVYYKTDQYEKARMYFEQAGQLLKEISGENTVDYHIILNNLALLHMEKEEYARAAEIFEKARRFFQNEMIETPQNYISATTNLAKAYMELGKDQQAEQLLRESIAVLEKRQGADNARSILEKRTLADLYIRSGHYQKASGVLDSLTRSFLSYIQNSFAVLTEKSRNEYLLQHSYLPDLSNSLHYLYAKAPAYFTQRMWGYQLLLKSLSLDDTKAMLAAVQQQPDSSLRNLFQQWKTLKARLAYQYSLPAAKRDADLYNSTIRLEALERDINHRSTLLGRGKRYDFIPVQELAKNLGNGEAAVDFVRFDFYNKKWTDSSLYAAYILRKGDSIPVFVPLFEEKQLQRILDSAGRTATSMVNNIYRGLEGKGKATGALGTELYQLVWAPLESHLKGIKKISYSPAGKLYGIAFHALPVDSTTLLMDKYELRQYTSTRQVALRKIENRSSKIESIVLFGDAAFSMDSTALAKTKGKGQPSSGIYTPRQRGESSGSWSNLPGTAEEVKKVKMLFDNNKIASRSFTQTTANEENLKALGDQSPQVLHIATHGFFLPEPDKKRKNAVNNDNSYSLAEDPLLRSGLILAGGNYAWSGKTPVEGAEDGIATAYEISQLNLSNTELVVLSACETALGDIKGSEGVFGLQRAFKMAGVKKLIVSLWQVPDKETAELMTNFYTYWLKGKTIEEAFSQSQSEMRKKYPAYYWAAFVLVE